LRSIAVILGLALGCLAADPPQTDIAKWIESQGGEVVRGADGSIVEVSLARTWATNNDIERVVAIKGLKRLDLSFTYVNDQGIERLQELKQLEELTLDTCEFITDAAMNYLRVNKTLRKLNLRGTDITDVSLPHIAELTNLVSLNLSYTQLGDVGIESLPALAQLEELNMGGTRISGINLNNLKLLPKLKKLTFGGIQRRNAGACWTPMIIDLDMEPISMLSGLEELHLGVGYSLGKSGVMPSGGGNCRVTGGIKLTDLGVTKLAKLKNLRRLDISGAKITKAGLEALKTLPNLERLSLWNTSIDDSAAQVLAAFKNLTSLDLSDTGSGDATLQTLAQLPKLKQLYLTDTKATPAAVEAFRKQKPEVFVSWARRPEPLPPLKADATTTGNSR
jgi:internalin A